MRPAGLPPLLRPGLSVVFIGTEPGEDSLRIGHYYANPSNSFYADLDETDLTAERVLPKDDHRLLEHGIGLDDVYHDPARLRLRIEAARPRGVCFNSKRAVERFLQREHIPSSRWKGDLVVRLVEFAGVSVVWAVPDSSGLARGYHEDRIRLLRELRARSRAV